MSKCRTATSRPDRYINRTKHVFEPGTRIYNWRFLHPKFGWCGGGDLDDWSESKATIQNMMRYCEWPSELIESVA